MFRVLALALCLLASPALAQFNNLTAPKLSFTPTFTFATSGDLSVAYTSRIGYYTVINKLVCFNAFLNFTPTYTTSTGTGNFVLTGLPPADGQAANQGLVFHTQSATLTWPASRTLVVGRMVNGTNTFQLIGLGTGVATTVFSITQFPTATAQIIGVSGCYNAN